METHTCHICNKQFKSERALFYHMPHHREGYVNPSVERLKEESKALQEEYKKNPMRCKQCNSPISYRKAIEKRVAIKRGKAKNIFCCSSCAATYHNTHKTHGYSRSKLEIYVEDNLIKTYPMLELHFNRNEIINSELDVYIPLLKLAFELNGIFHYKPIYGVEKLKKQQANDIKKLKGCEEKRIDLHVIDSSELSYFTEANAKPYLDIIDNTIKQKIKDMDLNLDELTSQMLSTESHIKIRQAEIKRKIINSRTCICKTCNKEFIYKTTPRQTFCSTECKATYIQNNSKTYQYIASQKQKVLKGLSEGLSIIAIGKIIGFKVCAGGYFYTLKTYIETLQKESAQ